MEIRKLKDKDINEVVNLWYEASVIAHNFISFNYWGENKDSMVNEYLPNSETYLALKNQEIVGFVTMVENYLAALFVKNDMQRKGIGNKLLNYAKDQLSTIQLKVYKKNLNSIQFYKSQGFKILSEETDGDTNELELLMEWNK